jgi:hypothetical protein
MAVLDVTDETDIVEMLAQFVVVKKLISLP